MKVRTKLLAGVLICGLHISGCIGGLLSIPAAAALQWSVTTGEPALAMTPAVFLCREADEQTDISASEGCDDSGHCITQSGRHFVERMALSSRSADHGPTAASLFESVPLPVSISAPFARSGPLIAALETPLHPFVQRE